MSAERSVSSRPDVWQSVHQRVHWWLNDMAFKAPEQLSGRYGEHYFECMAQDIANFAVEDDGELGTLSAASRLDP